MKKKAEYQERNCNWCGLEYKPLTSRHKHCAVRCRFLDKCEQYKIYKCDSDCWEWGGSIANSGYGQMAIGNDTPETTHRLSYLYNIGEIPEDKIICHHCDNRKCFNPGHIYAGTYQSNVDDMYIRGRQNNKGNRKGENHPASSLSDVSALEILDNFNAGEKTKRELSEEYKCSIDIVRKITSSRGRFKNLS